MGRIWTERHEGGEERVFQAEGIGSRRIETGEMEPVWGPGNGLRWLRSGEVEVRAATSGGGHAIRGLKCQSGESVVKRKGNREPWTALSRRRS